MNKKNGGMKPRNRQRQKLSRRTIIIIAASGAACIAIALTIFLQTVHVDKTAAAVRVFTVEDARPVVDKTLDAPILKDFPVIGPNTVLVRPLKADYHAPENH